MAGHGQNLYNMAMPTTTDKTRRRPPNSKGSQRGVFGQGQRSHKHPLRAGIYARVSASHQQTIALQVRQLREYADRRDWEIASVVREVESGAKLRPKRAQLIEAARRRELDVVLVWRLDRWGRSLDDLVLTLRELQELGVAFVSLTEAFDLTTPTGRAMAGMVAVFAEFEREIRSERVRAGIEQARAEGRQLGRPLSAGLLADEIQALAGAGVSKAEIARRLGIGRTSVRRILKIG